MRGCSVWLLFLAVTTSGADAIRSLLDDTWQIDADGDFDNAGSRVLTSGGGGSGGDGSGGDGSGGSLGGSGAAPTPTPAPAPLLGAVSGLSWVAQAEPATAGALTAVQVSLTLPDGLAANARIALHLDAAGGWVARRGCCHVLLCARVSAVVSSCGVLSQVRPSTLRSTRRG